MDQFFRKQKPRSDPISAPGVSPPDSVTKIPRAIVKPVTVDAQDNLATPVTVKPLFPTQLQAGKCKGAGIDPVPRTPVSANAAASLHTDVRDLVEPCTPQTPKPRKRFRKKVNGLFGDQTDLKRRMAKLLRDISTADVLANKQKLGTIRSGPVKSAEVPLTLTLAKGVIQRLNEPKLSREDTNEDESCKAQTDEKEKEEEQVADTELSREFDFPELTATASRILGSPERLQQVHRTMGRLSPRSNEQFIEEMELGESPKLGDSATAEVSMEIKPSPPVLPRSAVIDTQRRRQLLEMSPISVDRSGTPAVLRRKVRRVERGYRSADVLQIRLYGNQSSEMGSSPVPTRRVEKLTKNLRGKGRKLDSSGYYEHGQSRLDKWFGAGSSSRADESQQDTENDSYKSPVRSVRPKKRRKTITKESEEQDGTEGSALASDPFQMLVEVAVERKESSLKAAQSRRSRTEKKKVSIDDERPWAHQIYPQREVSSSEGSG